MKVVIRNVNNAPISCTPIAEFNLNSINSGNYDEFRRTLNAILTIQAVPVSQPNGKVPTSHTVTHDLMLNNKQIQSLEALIKQYAEPREKLFKTLFHQASESVEKVQRTFESFIQSNVLFSEIESEFETV